MFLIDYIEPFYFIISFTIGIFIVYMYMPQPDVIVKYPTPENANDTIFKDDVDNCYKFKTTEIPCKNNEAVNVIPVQKRVEEFKQK